MEFNTLNIQDLQLDYSLDIDSSTGSMSMGVDIPLSQSRSGFNPSLSLHYTPSSNNSVFGIGWSLGSLPFIGLDTSKGLPKYDGSDNFAFNGSSLIPYLIKNGTQWEQRVNENTEYWVYFYRSKVEDSFTRFEKWVNKTNNEVHWRARTKNNILSIYGKNSSGLSKIYDPEQLSKISIWLLESQYDDNGNAIFYNYKKEDSLELNALDGYETSRLNKFNTFGFTQRYPDKILYGNTKPIKPDESIPSNNKWLFEIAFDYGNYPEKPYSDNLPTHNWKKRKDPFSTYNPGFEIRTYRLCRRVLMYHHFDELVNQTSLVNIFNCNYNENELGTTLESVAFTGVRKDINSDNYSEKSLPALKFTYTQPLLDNSFHGVVGETNDNLPQGFNSSKVDFVDLLGEGIPGILTESNGAWYYKENLGNGKFAKQETVISKPSQQIGSFALGDFNQDGNLNLFSLVGQTAGYYEYNKDTEKWSGFIPFKNIPQVNQAKFFDVNSDGLPDLIVETEDKIVCYPFKGKEGFGKPYEFFKPTSNGSSYVPTIGNNLSLDYFLTDMTGDGLPDQVRIKNGSVEYYPNLGNGYFGEKIIMKDPPIIDFDTTFDASKIILYDLDGSGTSDIIYIGNGELRYWYNASGNTFIQGGKITNLPYIDNLSSVKIIDFLENGTPCLIWSNSLNQQSSIQYLQLTNGIKPRLLTSIENSMGQEEKLQYSTSAHHYLRDKKSSSPWISKLPSHFTVVDKKETIDHISNTHFITQYKYKDGHYDGGERTFVTFGLVEQYDTEFFENVENVDTKNYAEPFCVKTWFHNGIFGWDSKRIKQYYDKDLKQSYLVHQSFENSEALTSYEFENAYRSLGKKPIRQEIFATSKGKLAQHPYQTSQTSYKIRKIQPKTEKHDSSFFTYQSESLEYEYEQNPQDPKISHSLTLGVDNYGEIEQLLSIAYSRRSTISNALAAQKRDYITGSTNKYTYSDTLDKFETGILYEGKDYEINHINRSTDGLVQFDEAFLSFDNLIENAIDFNGSLSTNGIPQARIISWDKTFFWNNDFTDVLPLGEVAGKTFSHHEESACFNDSLIDQVYNGKITNAMLSNSNEGNYKLNNSYWWQKTDINYFYQEDKFFNLKKVQRSDNSITEYKYDKYNLNIVEIKDPLGNITRGEIDYNIIEPFRLIDQNDNISEVLYDPLGVVIASFNQGTVLDKTNTLQKYGSGLLSDYSNIAGVNFEILLANPANYLQKADNYFYYDFEAWVTKNKPLSSINIAHEKLLHDGEGNITIDTDIQISIDYIDGFGRTLQSKQKVESGSAIKRLADDTIELDIENNPVNEFSNERYLVSGHVVYNNKQQPVRQFEPFFSSIVEFENDEVLKSHGVAAHTHYNAIGREIRVDFPNDTFSEIKITPWEIQSFDENDTVERSIYKENRELLPSLNSERIALNKALSHKETPDIVKLDPLGRDIIKIQINNNNTERKIENIYDINGNVIEIIDARTLSAFTYKYDMLGRILYEKSIDAGETWSFHNNLDQSIHLWDSKNIHQKTQYDLLSRVVSASVDGALGLNQITERFIYGDDNSLSNTKEKNLRGQLVKHYDQAGTLEVFQYTPSGLPIASTRKLLDQFTNEPDWSDPTIVTLSDSFISEHVYDGFGRLKQQKLPDLTTRKFVYHRSGGVHKILVSTADGTLIDEEILKDTAYDAKGLRQKTLLGNNVEQNYTYDTETFRMSKLQSRKNIGGNRTYQDIEYTYDPVGNLVYLVDKAQQSDSPSPHVIEGLNVSAHSEFEYDALYQLKSAKGRVHQGLMQGDYRNRSSESGAPSDWGKGTRHISLNNGAAVERYTREYEYDTVGNIKHIKHIGTTKNWTKKIWTSSTSNRSLPKNDLNGNLISNPEGKFDANGNCIYMPHLHAIEWNYRNNISKAVLIDRSSQGKPDDVEYYVYGGDGIRVRKITQRVVDVANDTIELTEKIYLDGCEIKRITLGGLEILKRCTSNISDGNNNIVLIHAWEKDTFAREVDDISNKKIHYQLSDHLSSASLELDQAGDVITYEEYFPFGGSSFIAGKNKRDIALKDHRYSGKGRDDFTGLYYFGYRYYAHFIGGWLSPDPIGPEDSENLYLYVHNNPINLVDPNGLQSTNPSTAAGGINVTQAPISSDVWNTYTPEQQSAIQRGDFVLGNGNIITKTEMDRRVQAGAKFNLHIISGITNIRQDPRWQEWRDLGMSEDEADATVEMFRNLDEAFASLHDILDTVDSDDTSGSEGVGNTTSDAGGETADSNGTGCTSDTNNGATHNGTGGGTQSQTNAGGGGGNTSDGTEGSGLGQKGTGTGGGGNTDAGSGGTGEAGTGRGNGVQKGSGSGTKSGTGQNAQGSKGKTGKGEEGKNQNGSPDGVSGGVLGGSSGGNLDEGSLDGDINGSPDGTLDGSLEGPFLGTEPRNGDPASGDQNQGNSDTNEQQQGERGQQSGAETNWLDTATRFAGYLNLEFGSDGQNGKAGGIPGGMNLFNLDLPMWTRRTLQVAFIATTIITTVIPIGKAVIGAKAAILGLKATARKALTTIISKLPSKAGVSAIFQRIRGSISSKIRQIRATLSRRPLMSEGDPLRRALGAARNSHPEEFARTMRELKDAGAEIIERSGTMAYSPSRGRAGQLILDPKASIGALRHEVLHFADDLALGQPGLGYYLQNPGVRWAMEFRSYSLEINIARRLRRFDIARELVELARKERKLLLGR